MSRAVWIDGTRFALAPSALLGQGGEAEVYDLGDGRVDSPGGDAIFASGEPIGCRALRFLSSASCSPRKRRLDFSA